MFFRIANNGEYYARGSDYSNLKKCVSDDIDLVYWDYYSLTKGEYENLAAAHKKIANNVVFAGGAWKWTSYAPACSTACGCLVWLLRRALKTALTRFCHVMGR